MVKIKNKPAPSPKTQPEAMVFGKKNYVLLTISAVVIVIGFFLMSGSEGVVDVKSTKLTVAPVVVMLGFVIAIYSILVKSPESDNSNSEEIK